MGLPTAWVARSPVRKVADAAARAGRRAPSCPLPPPNLPQGLVDLGYELVSTGGSAAALTAAGLPVTAVDALTGYPEMLDGAPKDGIWGWGGEGGAGGSARA